MSFLKKVSVTAVLFSFILFISCDKNGDIVLFSINDDIELGEQVAAEIEADPATYPILDRSTNAEAYAYIDNMFNDILNADAVTYRDEFNWEIFIIDDEVLNAFATPGGKVYIYTGLMFYLNQEDDLAGVIGHEIAHADRRHSSKQLQTQYGISVLLGVLTGGQSETVQAIAGTLAGLGSLQFSQDDESEADAFSVEYLADTDYACNGAATFFEKLVADGSSTSGIEEFLSTHPPSDERVADINTKATEVGCSTTPASDSRTRYEAFLDLLR